MHFYNNRVSTLGKRKGGMFLNYQKCLFGYLGIVVCQYVPGRKSSSSLLSLLLLLLPCSVLLLLAYHCHWRRRSPSSGESSSSYSSSVQRLRNFISRRASSSSAMFRSVALLLRSDQIIIIIIALRQTGLPTAWSGSREARRHHHLLAGFGFLRPPACQLSCCLSPCP